MRSVVNDTKIKNKMKLQLPSLSVNEGMARAAVAAFCAKLDPGATDIADIKCAVSEAVTNCIVHAYRNTFGVIYITVTLYEDKLCKIEIRDRGCGIPDVREARQPLFTTDAEGERSGMGFTVMESFTDGIRVRSKVGVGTTVTLLKRIGPKS
jgi:stage II sporulation protein AB (anti-sigma F factor)